MSGPRALSATDAASLGRCIAGAGVAVLPTDTVYGLACDPGSEAAVRRLYELKGRTPRKPAAVMLLDRERAIAGLPGSLGGRTLRALRRLLPGAVTVLLPNPARLWPLACAGDPDTLGLRVPALGHRIAALADVSVPLLQSSANVSGGPDAASAEEVPRSIREGADLVLDAGPAPGTPSTVVDLRAYDSGGEWVLISEGAVARGAIDAALG